ncbi:hypothetical protein [Streptomyces cyaneofuscatus]|uniref:hypothetical protein n=1 Tax=Streptomyces cyaneofuscatus TaxID=66883 RepID=UPI00369C07D8
MDAGVFVDAGGAEGSAACADGDFAPFEVAEEFMPFLVGGDAVFLDSIAASIRPPGTTWGKPLHRPTTPQRRGPPDVEARA